MNPHLCKNCYVPHLIKCGLKSGEMVVIFCYFVLFLLVYSTISHITVNRSYETDLGLSLSLDLISFTTH